MNDMELDNKQIMEGNEKFAKLLGWYQEDDRKKPSDSWFMKDEFAIRVAYDPSRQPPFMGLPFHRDWNYLMQVIDKLGCLIYRGDDWKNYYTYAEVFQRINGIYVRSKNSYIIMNNIESTWLACITWLDNWNSPEYQQYLKEFNHE